MGGHMRYLGSLVIFVVIFVSVNYSYALTSEQIIRLKEAGVEDQTIRMMILQERELQARERENPADLLGTRVVKDGDGNSAMIYSTGKSRENDAGGAEQEKVEKAWKMLQNMIIDNRK